MHRGSELDAFYKFVDEKEGYLPAYATKSIDARFIGGKYKCFRDYYEEIFTTGSTWERKRHRWRTPFQLDRDSILYSSLFSRLAEKTHLYTGRGRIENRMTHTLRVAQLARTICRSLKLNEDLGEAIAFGHDCGHPPYAHVGQEALNEWLDKKLGSPEAVRNALAEPSLFSNALVESEKAAFPVYTFSSDLSEKLFAHGKQAVRLLTLLRKDKVDTMFTRNTLFGIYRHSRSNLPSDSTFTWNHSVPGQSDNDVITLALSGDEDATIETQVVRYADDIAWLISDLTESLRDKHMLDDATISDALNDADTTIPEELKSNVYWLLDPKRQINLYGFFLSDLIEESIKKLQSFAELNTDDEIGKEKSKQFILFSEGMEQLFDILRNVIWENIIKSPLLVRGSRINNERVKALCDYYYDTKPTELERDIRELSSNADFPFRALWFKGRFREKYVKAFAIADFVSVLTDYEVGMLSETIPQAFRIW